MATAPAIIAAMFGDAADWIKQLPYFVVQPEMMLSWVLRLSDVSMTKGDIAASDRG
jgi:hypothetical protein